MCTSLAWQVVLTYVRQVQSAVSPNKVALLVSSTRVWRCHALTCRWAGHNTTCTSFQCDDTRRNYHYQHDVTSGGKILAKSLLFIDDSECSTRISITKRMNGNTKSLHVCARVSIIIIRACANTKSIYFRNSLLIYIY